MGVGSRGRDSGSSARTGGRASTTRGGIPLTAPLGAPRPASPARPALTTRRAPRHGNGARTPPGRAARKRAADRVGRMEPDGGRHSRSLTCADSRPNGGPQQSGLRSVRVPMCPPRVIRIDCSSPPIVPCVMSLSQVSLLRLVTHCTIPRGAAECASGERWTGAVGTVTLYARYAWHESPRVATGPDTLLISSMCCLGARSAVRREPLAWS